MKEKTKKHSKAKKDSSLDEHSLSPKAKALLEELSLELGLSKETVAELARTMYRLYKDKE
ncbi:MAG: hypothetical protein EOM50_09600 [Erysipelotrichia bacterium]|nr:hypothetical protein [Erysipelotrichia bacterium]